MMTNNKYVAQIDISKEEFDFLNSLFAIDLEDCNNLLGQKDDTIGVAEFVFEDGATIVLNVCSGSYNYFDDWIYYKDDTEIVFDCEYALEQENELVVDDTTYICKFNIKE